MINCWWWKLIAYKQSCIINNNNERWILTDQWSKCIRICTYKNNTTEYSNTSFLLWTEKYIKIGMEFLNQLYKYYVLKCEGD